MTSIADHGMACFGGGCYSNGQQLYECPEEEKMARMRDKQITKALKNYHRQEMKKLKLLLLGKYVHMRLQFQQ